MKGRGIKGEGFRKKSLLSISDQPVVDQSFLTLPAGYFSIQPGFKYQLQHFFDIGTRGYPHSFQVVAGKGWLDIT